MHISSYLHTAQREKLQLHILFDYDIILIENTFLITLIITMFLVDLLYESLNM